LRNEGQDNESAATAPGALFFLTSTWICTFRSDAVARRKDRRDQHRNIDGGRLAQGLDAVAGQAILTARGLTGQEAQSHALIARYSGNPLALKLVAQTVHELFDGAPVQVR